MNLPKTGRFVCLLILGLCVLPGGVFAGGAAYDPLKIPQESKPEILSFIVNDAARQRSIPVRLYLPPEAPPAPIVLFSHGLGGSGIEYAYLGEHWALRGYAAVFIQHPGSDTSVWQDKPPGQRMAAMQEAASLSNFILRVKDVPAVLDELQLLNKTGGHALFGRLDPDRIGMSGHSFGAITTQAMGGQTYVQGISFHRTPDKGRPVVMSPTSPPNQDPKQAFASVKIPWMVMTGTADISFIGNGGHEQSPGGLSRPSPRRQVRIGPVRRRALRLHRSRPPGRQQEAEPQPSSRHSRP